MKKLLYILPIVLLMGFVISWDKAKIQEEPKTIVFDFDDNGVLLGGDYVLASWSINKFEKHLGKPNRFGTFGMSLSYDSLGINIFTKGKPNYEPENILLYFNQATDQYDSSRIEAFTGKVKFYGKNIPLKGMTVEEFCEKHKEKGVKRVTDNPMCVIHKERQVMKFYFNDDEIDMIVFEINK